MRHRNKGRKLSRTYTHRKALLRNMATSLFRHERIETTTAKAKELRPVAERLITLARRGDVHARRLAGRKIQDREVLGKLFDVLLPALEFYNMGPAIIREAPLDLWQFAGYVGGVFGYSLIYTAIALVIGLLLFEDRDLA